jgi:hypothetical protein
MQSEVINVAFEFYPFYIARARYSIAVATANKAKIIQRIATAILSQRM